MLTRLDVRGVAGSSDDLASRLPRPSMGGDEAAVVEAVRAIIADVRSRGDDALRELTERFDGVVVDAIAVPEAEIKDALASVDPALRTALATAAANIARFQAAEAAPPVEYVDGGLVVRTMRRPVDRAGCYVPGGRAPLLSTVLHTAVVARVAGVPEVVLATPPGPDGRVPVGVLAAAAIADVDAVFCVGGAQAIAALAYGTASVPPVDVIVGPGAAYTAVAKREVASEGRVGVPSAFAGPSEVVVIADESVDPSWAAIDVVLQAEHGPDGLAWLITGDDAVADRIIAAVTDIVERAPRRAEIESTLAANGYCVLVDGADQAMEVVNLIAPEHLELLVREPEPLVAQVRHAGAVFCGPFAPASLGDYAAGPSHVLPTYGSARFAGALTVDDFTKPVHVIEADRSAFERLAPVVVTLAEAEGLAAHADSVRIRQNSLRLAGDG